MQVLAVTALMLIPRPPPAIDTGWDKINHLLAFAGPSFAGLAALPVASGGAVARLGLGLLAWGGAMEIGQSLVPPRSADAADLLADALGIVLGAAAYATALAGVRKWKSSPRGS